MEWISQKRMYLFTTKDGAVWWIDPSLSRATRWFTIHDVLDGGFADPGAEKGFLGIALSPEFKSNPVAYVMYTAAKDKTQLLRLARWTFSGEAREEALLEIPAPGDFHFAGHVRFGPNGYLYVSVGELLQSKIPGIQKNGKLYPTQLSGAILRIDVDSKPDSGKKYAIPPGNPFRKIPGAPAEVWAHGFRNPWKFLIDSDGRLFVGDVGENSVEELNLVEKGGFYGWPIWEGRICHRPEKCKLPEYGGIAPVVAYGRQAGVAIIAGYEHMSRIPHSAAGKILFADHVPGRLWALEASSASRKAWQTKLLTTVPCCPTTIAEAKGGGILIATKSGEVYLVGAPDNR